jgi:hypothetical protein
MTAPKYTQLTKMHEFRNLRREDPRVYWSPACQMTMHRIAMREGEKFFTEEVPQGSTNTDYSAITSPPESSLDRKDKIAALRRALAELENSDAE